MIYHMLWKLNDQNDANLAVVTEMMRMYSEDLRSASGYEQWWLRIPGVCMGFWFLFLLLFWRNKFIADRGWSIVDGCCWQVGAPAVGFCVVILLCVVFVWEKIREAKGPLQLVFCYPFSSCLCCVVLFVEERWVDKGWKWWACTCGSFLQLVDVVDYRLFKIFWIGKWRERKNVFWSAFCDFM